MTIHFSQPAECPAPRTKPSHQLCTSHDNDVLVGVGSSILTDMPTTLGGMLTVRGASGAGEGHVGTLLSAQFCCGSKAALEK